MKPDPQRRRLVKGAGAAGLAAIAAGAAMTRATSARASTMGERTSHPSSLRSLSVEIPATVRVRRASPAKVVVHAEAAVLDRIAVEAGVDGRVRVHSPQGFSTNAGVLVEIECGDLVQVAMTAGSLEAAGVFAPRFELRMEGAADAHLVGIKGERFTMLGEGSGEVTVEGICAEQDIEIRGAANYDGGSLRTRKARVRILGSGDAQVAASEVLDVEITGVGNVTYRGSPEVRRNITGVGAVEPARN